MEKKEVIIVRNGYDITVDGVKCPVNIQASKGPGNEVLDMLKVVGEEWQRYISLTKLEEGEQIVELNPKKQVVSTKKYELTEEEKAQVVEYQSKIDAIIDNAKKRYIPKPKVIKDITKMSQKEKLTTMEYLENLLKQLKIEQQEETKNNSK